MYKRILLKPVQRIQIVLFVLLIICFESCSLPKKINTTVKPGETQGLDTMVYSKSSVFERGFAHVENDSTNFYIDTTGQRIFDTIIDEYHPIDSIIPTGAGYVSLRKNQDRLLKIVSNKNSYGLVDDKGKEIIPIIYDLIQFHYKRYLSLYRKQKMTFADSWGNQLLPLKFEEVRFLTNRYFDVSEENKWGVYDSKTDKLIIPIAYDDIDYCGGCGHKSSYIYAKKNGKWGIIDFNNNILIPFKYDHAHSNMRSDQWVASFKKEGNNLIINIPSTKEFDDSEFNSLEIINGVLIVEKNDKQAIVNKQGVQISDFEYDEISALYTSFQNEAYLSVKKDGKYGILDTLGKTIVPPIYRERIIQIGDYFYIKQNGKYGVLTKENKELLPIKYKHITEIIRQTAEGNEKIVFQIKDNEHKGLFFPETGALIPPIFDNVRVYHKDQAYYDSDFPPQLVQVVKNNKTGYYTINGEEKLSPSYTDISFLGKNMAILRKDKETQTGLYDIRQQKVIIPYIYDNMSKIPHNPELIMVSKNQKNNKPAYGIFNTKGREILPLQYQSIQQLYQQNFLLQQQDGNYVLWNAQKQEKEVLAFQKVSTIENYPILIVENEKGTNLYDVKTGKLLLDNMMSKIIRLNNGQFVVFAKNDQDQLKYGYANSQGELVVPPIYEPDNASTIYDLQYRNYFPLFKKDAVSGRRLIGFADFNGKILVKPVYHSVFPEVNGNGFITEINRKFGLISASGKELLPPNYDINPFSSYRPYGNTAEFNFPLMFGKNGQWQYIQKNGNILPISSNEVIEFIKRRQ